MSAYVYIMHITENKNNNNNKTIKGENRCLNVVHNQVLTAPSHHKTRALIHRDLIIIYYITPETIKFLPPINPFAENAGLIRELDTLLY